MFTLNTAASISLAFTGTSSQFSLTMQPRVNYLLTTTSPCWIKQGVNPTATEGNGSVFVPGNYPVLLSGSRGPTLAILQEGAGSNQASLCPVES